ncbi:MAG: hypothetical protein NZ840_11640, partial [Anaerolineales bacterium]|nr:hypothetical protein [Anaerolineales bacterium]MDW8162687.1 hypothetical protein [Anaerolineales bacterium]
MRTRNTSLLLTALVVILFVLGVSAPPLLAHAAVERTENNPTASNKVKIVVQFSGTDRLIREVEFSDSTITGLQALLNTGLDVVTKDMGWGIAVCSIEGVGCPASNCFCDLPNFWNYEYWDGSQWQAHGLGASATNRSDGDVDGWRWGQWGGTPILPYPQLERAWNALQWLKAQQNSDGGYGSPSSSASSSVESSLAVGANHYKAADWRKDANSASLLGYLMGNGAPYTQGTASAAGKFAVGASATRLCMPPLAK